MTGFANCLLLLVRSGDDLPRACREAAAFLAFQGARLPTAYSRQDGRLVGIWVDPVLVDLPPEVLGPGSATSARHFRIRESVGVSGMWCLCWLDGGHVRQFFDLVTLRETLVSALIAAQPPPQGAETVQFVPVFDAADDCDSILVRTDQLRELFPGLIGEPMSWNSSTGALTNLIGGRRRN